jgi:hypothetical protein
MAPRDTKSEAFQAGQENPYIGAIKPLQFLNALPSAIGAEISGSDMGTPVGAKFKAQLKQSGAYAKRLEELRAKHPEEFGRGQMMAQQAADPYELGLGLGTLGMMTPYGRTTFDMAGGGAAPEGIFANPELSFRPRGRGPGPEGAPINAGFDVPRGMNRYQANQYYMTHGIPGDEIYFRSNPPMPYPTARNAFEEGSVLAANKTRPSPAPANYDYMGPSVPGPVTQRPMSDFDRASMGANWSGQGKGQYGRFTPGTRTGPFREGDFPPYSPEEMGQAVAPYRAQTQVQPQGLPPENYPYRPGPVGFQLLPPYERGGLPAMARGREIPYAEYRDVTGNVLAGPAREAPYGGGMDFGVTREGMAVQGGLPYGRIAAGAAGVGIPMMAAYYNSGREPTGARPVPQGIMEAPRGASQLPPIDIYGQNPLGAMEAAPVAQKAAPAAKAPKGGKKATPTPPKKPAEMTKEQAAEFEGNLNYYVTQMLDRLTGQNEAERGRMTQQYYERNPY